MDHPVGRAARDRLFTFHVTGGLVARPFQNLFVWVLAAPHATDMPDNPTASSLYLNRELSWLAFNARVLHEALDARVPLLERVKFLGIFSANLDEFYMVRIAGLRRQVAAGVTQTHGGGLTPQEQLDAIDAEI